MRLSLLAVGQRMPAWVDAGFEDYARRMPKEARLDLVRIKPEPRGAATPVERLIDAEAKRIRSALPQPCYTVVLDERGSTCTTQALAQRIENWLMAGQDVAFVIGGADGLAPGIRAAADWVWSLTLLTLPHGLVRVIVAEQLYRAVSILKNHPYHRE